MKPYAHHVSKVSDAINVLKSRGGPHYRTDIARFTGLNTGVVTAVLDLLEAEARLAPTAKTRTIPWTRQAGDTGGVATTNSERRVGSKQRSMSIQTQHERHHARLVAEFTRQPFSEYWAMEFAKAARWVGPVPHGEAKRVIQEKHLAALLAKGSSSKTAAHKNAALMARIESL